jgi:methanogenic corrinoid protein MtbC1
MTQSEDIQDIRARFIAHVADLNEEAALELLNERISRGEDPFDIVADCREGMRLVGERYEKRDYFLSGLIMAGEIFKEVMQELSPIITQQTQGANLGVVLLGTVAGDIHNIGKNILSMLLTSYGFTVHDLDVDVPPEVFLEKANQLRPDIIALSGLLTSSFESMRQTIDLIHARGEGPVASTPIIIGGSTVDYQVCRFVGADNWANDAMMGVRLFKQIIAGENP